MSATALAVREQPRPAARMSRAQRSTPTSSPSSTPTPRERLRAYAKTLGSLNDTRAELADSLARLESMLPSTSEQNFTGPVISPPALAR